jgi:hypothetical protein
MQIFVVHIKPALPALRSFSASAELKDIFVLEVSEKSLGSLEIRRSTIYLNTC